MINRVVLVGMSGVGKSFFGAKLAERLGFDFYDTDEVIENESGKSIGEIFALKGEEYFRESETAVLELLLNKDNCVISTGGGVVDRECNRELLSSERAVVFLDAGADYIVSNISGDTVERPKLSGVDLYSGVVALSERRRSLYLEVADFSVSVDECGESEREEVVLRLIINFLKN